MHKMRTALIRVSYTQIEAMEQIEVHETISDYYANRKSMNGLLWTAGSTARVWGGEVEGGGLNRGQQRGGMSAPLGKWTLSEFVTILQMSDAVVVILTARMHPQSQS